MAPIDFFKTLYTDTDWHHWICTYEASTGQRTIYRDGNQAAQGIALANYQGAGNWLVGQYPFGANFGGQLDDVRVYPRTLDKREAYALAQTGFRAATLTSGAGTTYGTWSATPPAGLEGLYRIDVRGRDANGLIDLTNLGQSQWTGMVDTLAPRVPVAAYYQTGNITVNDFKVRDFNLDADRLTMSGICAVSGSTSPSVLDTQYSNPVWYRLGGGQSKPFEYFLQCWQGGNQSALRLTVCDTAGHYTQQNSASPVLLSAAEIAAAAANTVAVALTQPPSGAVLTTTQPISVSGSAESLDFVDAITLTVDGVPLYAVTFPAATFTWSLESALAESVTRRIGWRVTDSPRAV